MDAVLADLAAAGIVECPGLGGLEVSQPFLAFATGTAGRLSLGPGKPPTRVEEADALRTALACWDEYRGDQERGARLLALILGTDARAPGYASLDGFAAA